MVNTFKNYSLPPIGSKIYDWPRDLVPPDLVIHVMNDNNLYEKYAPEAIFPSLAMAEYYMSR